MARENKTVGEQRRWRERDARNRRNGGATVGFGRALWVGAGVGPRLISVPSCVSACSVSLSGVHNLDAGAPTSTEGAQLPPTGAPRKPSATHRHTNARLTRVGARSPSLVAAPSSSVIRSPKVDHRRAAPSPERPDLCLNAASLWALWRRLQKARAFAEAQLWKH